MPHDLQLEEVSVEDGVRGTGIMTQTRGPRKSLQVSLMQTRGMTRDGAGSIGRQTRDGTSAADCVTLRSRLVSRRSPLCHVGEAAGMRGVCSRGAARSFQKLRCGQCPHRHWRGYAGPTTLTGHLITMALCHGPAVEAV